MSKTSTAYSVVTAGTKYRTNGTKASPMDIEKLFGENAFWYDEMQSRLPKPVYKSLLATIEQGEPLNPEVADTVALAMKEWAIERGATHYTHLFQPLTGATAEKHDSFITPNQGGGAIASFSGKNLIQGEPDASSFPSGGVRATFEARGYTAWDPTSPAVIIENKNGAYLAIPTAFASWTGEALDHKTPLLRSIEVLSKQALRALRLFGDTETTNIITTVGAEQEYFLIDEEFYYHRPDLQTSGRTLFGAKPPRGQQMDDHYFGAIPDRVLSFMLDLEKELYRLGIPVKTRHNEVAPSQYEIAPIFEHANISSDHQQLMMSMLQRMARKAGLVCLLHEKPFAGLNGSGKHNNWSMSTNTGSNLLEPGDTPHKNKRFLFFCTAIISAVKKHQDLLRIAVATAGNDHRLGANEAPPAIMSVFLGAQLEDIFAQLERGSAENRHEEGLLGLGTAVLPKLPRHSGDRNRTSPFAFTGNKFEFRAVGSTQTITFVNTVLNAIVSDTLDEMTTVLESRIEAGEAFDTALAGVLSTTLTEAKPIIFGGDNYAEAWHNEAETRGLLNLRTTMDAFGEMCAPKNRTLFAKYGILSERELESRHEIFVEQYVMTIDIEAQTTRSIAKTMILPAAIRAINDLTSATAGLSNAGLTNVGLTDTLREINDLVGTLTGQVATLETQLAHEADDPVAEGLHMRDHVIPAMNAIRETADQLEGVVPNDYWPLPSYGEMLFIK